MVVYGDGILTYTFSGNVSRVNASLNLLPGLPSPATLPPSFPKSLPFLTSHLESQRSCLSLQEQHFINLIWVNLSVDRDWENLKDRSEMERDGDKVASKFKRICVFYGSSQGKNTNYQDVAIELAKQESGIDFVFVVETDLS
ncbi:hypothetical protein L1987_24748 [Smallanthus sonchifolius]|uniref:Uncharacterized protein n=1 Tax=Smallanthus sonchifolius TaxID=185202 RepID=A0ACB9ILW2_9ASTR|nr:hypothetical protein L1987_24748 [Smallanthus sonchifolius]